jgi:D-sedoheptulose 7-phosphate isomerase
MPSSLNLPGVFTEAIAEHLIVVQQLQNQEEQFERAAIRISDALLQGHKVLWCGNGGSAAEAQHLSAELMGRFRRNRRPLASLALTSDSSVITAIANDLGFEEVFERQVAALCAAGDVVVGLSTSGQSRNVGAALQKARALGAFTVVLTGQSPGGIATHADVCLHVASSDTARIQEAHLLCGHILCDWIELATCVAQAVENPERVARGGTR